MHLQQQMSSSVSVANLLDCTSCSSTDGRLFIHSAPWNVYVISRDLQDLQFRYDLEECVKDLELMIISPSATLTIRLPLTNIYRVSDTSPCCITFATFPSPGTVARSRMTNRRGIP